MRRHVLLALIAAAACGGGGGSDTTAPPIIPTTPATPVATTAVSLQDDQFNPKNILVSPSAVVTFSNNDGISHNVIFSDTSIPSITEWVNGNRTSTMPATPGTYSYTCTIHAGMSGTVKVQ